MALTATDKRIEIVEDKSREICQYCKDMSRPDGIGYCRKKAEFMARKSTCDDFNRRRK